VLASFLEKQCKRFHVKEPYDFLRSIVFTTNDMQLF
jgi:hypothetical protein